MLFGTKKLYKLPIQTFRGDVQPESLSRRVEKRGPCWGLKMELKVMGWGVFKNNIYWKRIFISAGLYLKKNQQINVTGDAVLESNKTSEDTCQVPDDQNRGTPWQFSLSLAPPSDFGKNLNYHSGFSTPAHYYR